MEYIVSISTGVLSGVAASALFLWFSFSFFKPNLIISPNIAVSPDNAENKYVEIKFINKTKHSLNDVKVEILKSKIRNSASGTYTEHKEVKQRDLFHIAPYDKKDVNARYAFRVTEEIDINSVWHSDKYDFMTIMVHATHSMSGFSKSFRHEYKNKSQTVKVGNHGFGNDCEVYANT